MKFVKWLMLSVLFVAYMCIAGAAGYAMAHMFPLIPDLRGKIVCLGLFVAFNMSIIWCFIKTIGEVCETYRVVDEISQK